MKKLHPVLPEWDYRKKKESKNIFENQRELPVQVDRGHDGKLYYTVKKEIQPWERKAAIDNLIKENIIND